VSGSGREGIGLSKHLYIKTYGCQMNVYDSTRMADLLAPLGYRLVAASDEADLVILNTSDYRDLTNNFGMNLVHMTMKRGRPIYKEGEIAPRAARDSSVVPASAPR